MRLIVFFVFLSLAVTSCHTYNSEQKSKVYFKAIDFSYFDMTPFSFTLKIHNQDSFFLKEVNKNTSKAKLTGRWKQQLDSLMDVINFDKLDSVYRDGYIDGVGYTLDIESDTVKKHFWVHSMSRPKELEALKKLFLEIRMNFLPPDTTLHLSSSSPKPQVQGNPKTFVLNDIDGDKNYLADSIKKFFHEGYVGQAPLIAIDGIEFEYQRKLDTVMLPLSKSDIMNIGFLKKKDSRLIYGHGDNGAVIINTMRMRIDYR